MLRTLGDGYKALQLKGQSLMPFGGFYLATLGSAHALYLAHRIGNFTEGKEADFVVLDASRTAITRRRLGKADEIVAKVFALIMIGDGNTIADLYMTGRRQTAQL
jgi:guanine deaminase